jgi:phosphohistidine phosphatase SixA
MLRRRAILMGLGTGAMVCAGRADEGAAAPHGLALSALREGGVVVVMRHALAPGVGDPPGFELAACASQRNLSEEGRAQARRIGEWFQAQRLNPAAVRSSQWCRCLETARLAFGRVEPWPALNSLFKDRALAPAQDAAMRDSLAQVPRGGFEVWVTHQVNISNFAGDFMGSGEAVLVRSGAAGTRPIVVAPLKIS